MGQVLIKQGHHELAMLWVALIADSGYGKSPALNFARKPIDLLQIEAMEQYEMAMEQYEKNMEEYERQRKRKPDNTVLLNPLVLEKPTEPTMQRYSVSDATTEALLPVLADNPYGVCLIRDELAAFLGSMNAYKKAKTDRQIYIEFHGGHFVQSDRKTGMRHLAVKTPSLSIVGGIQSEVIRESVHSEPEFLTTGFGARFLMVYPPAKPIRWNHNVVDSAVLSSYDRLIETLVQHRKKYTHGNPGIVNMTPEAIALIFEFQNRHADEVVGIADGNIRYVKNKAGMHCARLALNLHVIHCAENSIDILSPITADTMQQAITLTEWFLNEAHRIYAMFAGKDEVMDREAKAILSKISELGGEAQNRDLRNIANYSKKGGGDRLEQKLHGMVEAGLLTVRYGMAKNNRQVKYYSIVPPPTAPTISENAEVAGDSGAVE
jgi:hypothetical protein